MPSARPPSRTASLGPLDMQVETPSCERSCVGKGDATGHHYEYACTCSSEPYERSMQVHVRDGIVYAVEKDGVPHADRSDIKGVWNVPCGARLRYPAGTQIVTTTLDEFELSPEEERAVAVNEAVERALDEDSSRVADAIGH